MQAVRAQALILVHGAMSSVGARIRHLESVLLALTADDVAETMAKKIRVLSQGGGASWGWVDVPSHTPMLETATSSSKEDGSKTTAGDAELGGTMVAARGYYRYPLSHKYTFIRSNVPTAAAITAAKISYTYTHTHAQGRNLPLWMVNNQSTHIFKLSVGFTPIAQAPAHTHTHAHAHAQRTHTHTHRN